ncbi:MAG TPA: acetate--CoA ligase family protein, partial [Trebonia sp.]|nr:acetate--CoA ligase family protein [Trebonia sp.]
VPTVLDLPGAPDVAVVMVRAAEVAGIAADCGALGVKHVVVLSSGFEETKGGASIARELSDISRRYGMGVVGPNSEGLWFVPGKTILTFGSAADRPVLRPGPVGVLSQSGSIGGSIMRRLNDAGTGANAFVSVGNETVLTAADYLEWLVDHGGIKVAACFLEGVKDGHRFLEVAARARHQDVAVVVLHSGTSDAGRAASASHTGKISTAAEVYAGLLDQAGVLQVGSVSELASAAAILAGPRLATAPGPGRDRRGLTVIGLSGGSRSIIADAAAQHDIPLARLSETTTKELAAFIPDFGAVENPVDPTGQVLSDPELFPRTLSALAADPNTEALLVQYANGGLPLIERHLTTLAAIAAGRSLPMVVGSLLDEAPADHPVRAGLAAAGIGYAHDPTQAVEALRLLFEWRRVRPLPPVQPPRAGRDPRPLGSWAEVAQWASEAGVLPPREAVLETGMTPAGVLDRLGAAGLTFPLVVKPSPDDVGHKSEAGLVHLSLASPAQVHKAIRHVAGAGPGCTRVLVQEQVATGVEILVVFRQDDDFGPVMGVGPGGFLVELLAEIRYVALPATPRQIADALRATRLGAQLAGYRGRSPVDVDLVALGLARLAAAYVDLAAPPRLVELNPVTAAADSTLRVLDSFVER